jgi:2-iminobutanoate/2-iminopropanoate deaminase
MRQVVTGPDLPVSTSPISQAIVASGTFVFTAGQIGRDPKTGTMAEDLTGQTRQALENLRTVLAAAGASLSDIVRMLVFVTDLSAGQDFNAVYAEFFGQDPPVRTRVQAAALAPGALVEIEAIAVLP